MSRDFLDPRRAAATARSPIIDAAAGAVVGDRDGWEVIVSFGAVEAESRACRDSVGFADLSQITKLELQGAAEALRDLGGEARLGSAREFDGGWHCPVSPTQALVLGPSAGESGLDPDRFERVGIRVCDLTASLAALAIVGPLGRDLIARFCALDLRDQVLPVGGFRPGSVARTPGYVLREGLDRFLILFGAAYAQYFWEVVADAAAALGGRPVGLEALAARESARSEERARA